MEFGNSGIDQALLDRWTAGLADIHREGAVAFERDVDVARSNVTTPTRRLFADVWGVDLDTRNTELELWRFSSTGDMPRFIYLAYDDIEFTGTFPLLTGSDAKSTDSGDYNFEFNTVRKIAASIAVDSGLITIPLATPDELIRSDVGAYRNRMAFENRFNGSGTVQPNPVTWALDRYDKYSADRGSDKFIVEAFGVTGDLSAPVGFWHSAKPIKYQNF